MAGKLKLAASIAAASLPFLMREEEAEAFPLGKLVKKLPKAVARGEVSSATARLVGKVFPELSEQPIKEVRKTASKWRYIIFEDGSAQPATSDVIRDMIRATRTKEYVEAFETKEPAAKLEQALKSLKMRLSRTPMRGMHPRHVKALYKQYVENVRAAGGEPEPAWLVKYENEYVTIPEKYADVLAEAKIIERIQRLTPGKFRAPEALDTQTLKTLRGLKKRWQKRR